VRDIIVSADRAVPPENRAFTRRNPSTLIGPSAGSCCTVKYTPRSYGIESNPQQCTSRAPLRTARSW
jgi:hypothetical protein